MLHILVQDSLIPPITSSMDCVSVILFRSLRLFLIPTPSYCLASGVLWLLVFLGSIKFPEFFKYTPTFAVRMCRSRQNNKNNW